MMRERAASASVIALSNNTGAAAAGIVVLEELFSVELCDRVIRTGRPRVGYEAWHAGLEMNCRVMLIQCKSDEKRVSRLCKQRSPGPGRATIARQPTRRQTPDRHPPSREQRADSTRGNGPTDR